MRSGNVSRQGLTLIELLMVVALIGAVLALVGPRFMSGGQQAAVERAMAACRDIDHRLRIEARDRQRERIIAGRRDGWYVRTDSGQWQARWQWPDDVRVEVRAANGDSLDEWTYDRAGRSADLTVLIRGPDHRHRQYAVAGLSGQWLEIEP